MAGGSTYNPGTDAGMVRLLLNDVASPFIFTDAEITALLALEGGNVKRAAAQGIDTNADNEALASKVLRTPQGLQTDGAKVADALRKRAASLREQAIADLDDGGFFEIVPMNPSCEVPPERTQWPAL